MSESSTIQGARALIGLTGNSPRRYVPGTASLWGRELVWTEQCKAICRHSDGGCYTARSSLLPSGPIDPPALTTQPGATS